MAGLSAWIKAARLRTLPLTLVCIGVGGAVAYYHNEFSAPVFWLSLLTAMLLQVLSNFANDYGDFVKGTDNEARVGPQRAMQSGAVSASQMKAALVIMSLASLLSGVTLIRFAPGLSSPEQFLGFLALGCGAIAAAITYTVGSKAYGYKGLGDIMVFLFFGLVGVAASYYLHAGNLNFAVWLPAASVGFFSVGVLNMNNTRDMENDKASGKITIPVRIGLKASKMYQLALVFSGMGLSVLYFFEAGNPMGLLWLLPSLAVFTYHMRKVWEERNFKGFDLQLKVCVLGTLLWGAGFMLFHFLTSRP